MGWASRRKKDQQDPARAERIQAMRQQEAQLRERLDSVLKAGQELGARVHYDSLSKESLDRVQALVEEFPKFLEQRVEVLGDCFLAYHDLRRECETLQAQLDARAGRATPADIDTLEPLLAKLPAKQADALRLVSALSRLPASPAPERVDAFDKAEVYLAVLEGKLAALRKDMHVILEITDERMRRGWVTAQDVEPLKAKAEQNLGQLEGSATPMREMLDSLRADYEALQQRRQELRRVLAEPAP